MTIEALSLLQAAAQAAGGQHYPASALYVVATPIGNLADITLRALHVLGLVDAVACEDTRHTAGLLRHYGIERPLLAVHEHNEREAAQGVLARLASGERVAYVSDAGTPAVSDPGARLVAAVREAGWRVVAVPGVSSATAALSVAGDTEPGGFRFVGFLPAKPRELEQALREIAGRAEAQVVFEAPHRIEALGRALAAACGTRPVTVCRELTKQFESVTTLPAAELPGWLDGDPMRRKGEFVLVLHARPGGAAPADALGQAEPVLRALVEALPMKQAVALAAQVTGAPRNALYERALALKQSDD
ncbi:16S rRNA (cytidine(1402)-2'-O)-methyltransferase [Caldimonas brevitalea]|uniref:Ribosomal RNA small subunit methyltransferase I n=1 Tax=Caldimonas brevitalea TaxID=413882 RepID=A0A0G3BZX5_9BURK|nr:16S rRNA (cytidine(1402)-2'-O)-methyltransferase [Caldimonas brevitalea]AKJ32090.1 16S rRNA methyltransferase [Caldimonas brevitalea]